ncbi:hypothetical protein [Dyadobacter sediminis]|uniref:hypothetical protein n=1 Tax=Dyadobacter sediminis TaxID=1493691 RepID=UPI001992D2D6|nr:hypothetical protein [Dyadobacter sediminis]GGB97227.1 hypothetical protein GCM10011325_25690 [Dyadobacter sediminis]
MLEPIGDKELSRGDTLAFTAKATSAFGQTKVFSLAGAPQGATIGASSGRLQIRMSVTAPMPIRITEISLH